MTNAARQLSVYALSLALSLAAGHAEAAGTSVDDASKAELDSATNDYERGVEAMEAEKYAEALTYFQKSYDTVRSPNSRMMVGRTLAKMGKMAAAYRELTGTLKQAAELAANQKKYRKTVATVQKELDELKDKLAYVSIKQGTQLRLGDEVIAPSDWQELQPVLPGTISAEISYADGRTEKKQLVLKPGERVELPVDTPPRQVASPPPASSVATTDATAQRGARSGLNRKTTGYVLGGVGLVGVGAFVGLTLIAAPSYGNSKAGCLPQGCPESGIDNEGSKGRLQGLGYAGLGLGVVGLGLGTWLVLTGDSSTSTAVQIGPAGVRIRGHF